MRQLLRILSSRCPDDALLNTSKRTQIPEMRCYR
jgi:hypothetical protein